MPIQAIQNRISMPILGKIRLGETKVSQGGKEYPVTVPYFVLDDAPEVEKVYGKNPKAIEVMFPSNDPNIALNTWLRWYGAGMTSKDGTRLGGKLFCYGNGPDPATGNPGTAHFMSKRDPVTRVVPTRPCLGEACPDYYSAKKAQQCKPSMKTLVLLPRVSLGGVYMIDTTSWNSIQNFHNHFHWLQRVKGSAAFHPFTMIREETATHFFNHTTQKEEQGKQYIMKIVPDTTFFERHGEEMQKRIASFRSSGEQLLLPSEDTLIELPMEDNFSNALPAVSVTSAPAAPQQPVADHLVNDPEVNAAFSRYDALKGGKLTNKAKLIFIKKLESQPNVKEAVLNKLNELILEEENKKAPVATVAQPAAAAPVVDADGII